MKNLAKKHITKSRPKVNQLDDLEEKQLQELDNYSTTAIRFGFVTNSIGSEINNVEQLLEKVEIAKQTTRTCFYQLRNLLVTNRHK